MSAAHTPGPWSYVPSTEHHGPYVTTDYGLTVADAYAMSNPSSLSVRNGGASRPIHYMAEDADANARLIAAAPELLGELQRMVEHFSTWASDHSHEATPETWAALHCAEAAIAKATA